MAYRNLGITLLISFCIMYGVMFLNVDEVSHIYLSTSRAYMALMMVSPMALLMLLMMRKMYPDTRKNVLWVSISVFVFAASLYGLRTQALIGDVAYMKAMIPHHSSAILTSKHAAIKDPEVRQLADSIIKAQEREIVEMKALLSRLK